MKVLLFLSLIFVISCGQKHACQTYHCETFVVYYPDEYDTLTVNCCEAWTQSIHGITRIMYQDSLGKIETLYSSISTPVKSINCND